MAEAERKVKPKRWSKAVVKLLDGSNRLLYKLTGGKLGNSIGGMPVLMLTTIGRRSGATHTHALIFLRDGQDYVVIASNGGSTRHPGWYFNVQDRPHVEIEYKGKKESRHAHIASLDERTRLWTRVLKMWSGYASYEAATLNIREIPLVILAPEEVTSSGN